MESGSSKGGGEKQSELVGYDDLGIKIEVGRGLQVNRMERCNNAVNKQET
jgi:hypothetical protein